MRYRSELDLIDDERASIQELMGRACSLGSETYNSEKLDALEARLKDIDDRFLIKLDDFLDKGEEAYDFIESIGSQMHEEVLKRRYLMGGKWTEVADSMGKTLRSVHYIRKEAFRMLEDIVERGE